MQRPHKEAGLGEKKLGKSVKFYIKMQDVNRMVYHADAEPTPSKKKGKRRKNIRVYKPVQTHKRIDALISLTV